MTTSPTSPKTKGQPAGRRRTLTGVVVKRSGDKTVAVTVTRVEVHKLYHKRRTRTKKYLAHDPNNASQVGDTVTIQESRPLSARKRWVIVPDSRFQIRDSKI